MTRPWTIEKPRGGQVCMIFRKPKVREGGVWHGWVYTPEGWEALVEDGWVRAVESVEQQLACYRRPGLKAYPPELKN